MKRKDEIQDTKPGSVKELHEANRRHWEATADEWKQRDEEGWRRCVTEPQSAFEGNALETILECAGELSGKKACVAGSGDNYASFALAGLGAEVTSVDFSEKRLQTAADRASKLGLKIQFVRDDAAEMKGLAEAEFDLVCSTNGFFVWLADLAKVFGEIARILKPGGYYVFFDIHPFQRPWKDQSEPLKMEKHYWNRRPKRPEEAGEIYEFHWTLADVFNALAKAGLSVCKVEESPAVNSRFWQGSSYGAGTDESLQDWKKNPRAGLPVWLTLAGVRDNECKNDL